MFCSISILLMFKSTLKTQAQIDAANAVTPLNRMGTKDEIAQIALYLASSGSDFMMGQTIALDGGKIIG